VFVIGSGNPQQPQITFAGKKKSAASQRRRLQRHRDLLEEDVMRDPPNALVRAALRLNKEFKRHLP
jgi:hypothetical protein